MIITMGDTASRAWGMGPQDFLQPGNLRGLERLWLLEEALLNFTCSQWIPRFHPKPVPPTGLPVKASAPSPSLSQPRGRPHLPGSLHPTSRHQVLPVLLQSSHCAHFSVSQLLPPQPHWSPCLHSLLCNGRGHLLKTQIRASHSLRKLQSPCRASKPGGMQPCLPPNPSLLQVAPATPRAAAGGPPCFSVYLFLCLEACRVLAWARCSLILADR